MTLFQIVAMGGTFDIIHVGHLALLERAFSVSDKVIVGLTGDELAKKKGKTLSHDYPQRLATLQRLIEKKFPDKFYVISKLDNDFGPAAIEGEVQALIVSDETAHQGDILNKLRAEQNMPAVQVVTVPMILAKDGKRISSTRIRSSEIDPQGNLIEN